MADDEKQTSEETEETRPEQAEETPPNETAAAPGSEAEEAADDGEAPPEADEDHDLTPSEEAEGPAEDAEPPAEEPDPTGGKPKEAKKEKDVIPGADLEPIAVEQSEENLSAEERARREAEEEERARREAELVGDGAEEEPAPASRAPAKLDTDSRFLATGKRKRSIARVMVLAGSGKIVINDRELDEFFPRPLHQTMVRQPLAAAGYEGSVDVRVRVHGGGVGGQAGAVRHGIARALTEVDPDLRGELKRRGFLTRDARVKERRKAGLKKARKRPQFSKR